MRSRIVLGLAGALLCAGCYRITVITGAPPATETTQTMDRPWQNSFVYGLVPPPELNTRELCPQGFAVVRTERSFLNGLVGAITYSIYTPMHTKVTCAVGPVPR